MLDQALLSVRQLFRDVDKDPDVLIALSAALEARDAVSFHADLGIVLRSRRNLDPLHGAIDSRNVYGGTQHCLGKGNRLFDIQIVPLTGKDWMREDLDIQIQISRRPSLKTRSSFAGQT